MSIGYWGSKKRFAKDIVDVLCRFAGTDVILYEPFCGMASVGMEALRRRCFKKVVFSDANENVIVYWHGLAEGWLPSERPLTVQQWTRLKQSQTPSVQRSFYGFDLGYGGHFLAGRSPCDSMNHRTHFQNARKRLGEATDLLRRNGRLWSFQQRSYATLRPRPGSVIYCDPPYSIVTTDGGVNNRNQHFSKAQMDELWHCIRDWLGNGCNVFLSSARKPYVPPDLCAKTVQRWDVPNNIQISKRGSGRRTELLLHVTRRGGDGNTRPQQESRKRGTGRVRRSRTRR